MSVPGATFQRNVANDTPAPAPAPEPTSVSCEPTASPPTPRTKREPGRANAASRASIGDTVPAATDAIIAAPGSTSMGDDVAEAGAARAIGIARPGPWS